MYRVPCLYTLIKSILHDNVPPGPGRPKPFNTGRVPSSNSARSAFQSTPATARRLPRRAHGTPCGNRVLSAEQVNCEAIVLRQEATHLTIELSTSLENFAGKRKSGQTVSDTS